MDDLKEEKQVGTHGATIRVIQNVKTRTPHPGISKEGQGAEFLVKKFLGLPIELRTPIFEAMYAEDKVIVITDPMSYFQKQTGFLDKTCAGIHTAGEAARALYHVNTWALPLKVLGEFMTYDIYGNGTRPENWLTSLVIPLPESWSPREVTRSWWSGTIVSSQVYEDEYAHVDNHYPGRERARQRLEILLHAKRLKEVEFRIMRENVAHVYLELRDIAPFIYRLKEKGIQVKVTANIPTIRNKPNLQDITEYFNEPTKEECARIGNRVLRRFDREGKALVTGLGIDPRFYRVILKDHYERYKRRNGEKERAVTRLGSN